MAQQTYSDHAGIYSVDMMFAYINLNVLPIANVQVSTLEHILQFDGWGDERDPTSQWSAMDVLANPEKYPSDYARIRDADLSFPIIVSDDTVIDGVHRLAKAHLLRHATIKAYVFDDCLMQKFRLANDTSPAGFDYVDSLRTYQLIQLYVESFIQVKN